MNRSFPDVNYFVAIAVALLVLGIIFAVTGMARGEEIIEIDMSIIAQIESSNNADAISYRGAKYGRGLLQISEICLKEWNMFNKEQYTTEDLFDKEVNIKIGTWYMNKRIPQMLKHFDKPVTIKNVLISYNAGIAYVVNGGKLPKETVQYIEKYNIRKGGI
jgi:soluble lytic murein transglycosylase-like protein